MTEKPANDQNARRGDAGMPDVSQADDAGTRPAPAPPRVPSSVRIPPRPAAPPTSAMPRVPGTAVPPAAGQEPGVPEAAQPPSAAPGSNAAPGLRADAGSRAAAKAPKRRSASGASQAGQLLAARVAQLRSAKLGHRARELGRTAFAGAQRLGLAKVGAAAAAVVVLGLVIWWLTSLATAKQQPAADTAPAPATGTSSSAPAARGPLPLEGVNALDFRLGDCFKDFDPNAPTSTVVACDTGHSAQLVAIESYAASDAYPGRDPLKQRALDACKSALLTDKSGDYVLSYKLAYPSSSSWGTGDRRVDCYVAADAGNVLMESLLP